MKGFQYVGPSTRDRYKAFNLFFLSCETENQVVIKLAHSSLLKGGG